MTTDDELTSRYRGLPQEEPSAELDARILAAAEAPPAGRSRWPKLAAAAAVLVLSIGIVSRIGLDTAEVERDPATIPESFDADRDRRQVSPAGNSEAVQGLLEQRVSKEAEVPATSADERFADQGRRNARTAAPAARREAPTSIAESPCSPEERSTAVAWWECIQALESTGQTGFEEEIEAYREVHGDPPAEP